MKNIQKCLNPNRIDFLMNYDCTCKGEKRSFTDLIYNRICAEHRFCFWTSIRPERRSI